MADPIEAARDAQKLIEAFERPLTYDGNDFKVGIRVGIALAPNHGRSANALIASTDLALYDAKVRRARGYSLFQEVFRQSPVARRMCETELKRAVASGELELYFQPQVRLSDQANVGAEALLRWKHPERGMILPGAFIQVLERSTL
jgi:predicted signal transduction protein with EAL and GGDEF domain